VLRPQIEAAINDGEPVECRSISRRVASGLDRPELLKIDFSTADVRPAFPPGLSCGQHVDLGYPPGSPGRVTSDVIVTTIGVRFKSYVSVVGRTLFINGSSRQKTAYKQLVKAHEAAIAAMTIGADYSVIYGAFLNTLPSELRQDAPDVLGRFAGIQIGTFSEVISATKQGALPANTSVILASSLSNVPDDGERPPFSVQVVDTVQVTPDGTSSITKSATKYKGNAYEIESVVERLQEVLADKRNIAERTRRAAGKKTVAEDEERQQVEMLKELRKPAEAPRTSAFVEAPKAASVSFGSPDQLPPIKQPNMIFLHADSRSVFLPLYGVMVPFHVSVIKSAVDEADVASARLSSLKITFDMPPEPDLTKVYVREFVFTAPGTGKFHTIGKQIRDLRVKYMQEIKRRKEQTDLYVNEKFVAITDGHAPRIAGGAVQVRPSLTGRKTSGNLEAHRNGFRYRSSQGDPLLVMYQNIRLAVLHLSVREMNTAIQLVLRQPITIATKPTTFVTFYKQIVESSVDVSGRQGTMSEQNELAEDEHERKLRKRINHEFKDFAKAVEALGEKAPVFERPIPNVGVWGVPHRSRVLLMPTVSALVSVTDQPFVLMREDIEVAILERVQFSAASFDLVIILNDWEYYEPGSRIVGISMIDIESKGIVLKWLDAIEVPTFIRKSTMDWKGMITYLKKEGGREKFIAAGAWESVMPPEDVEEEESDEFDADDSEEAADDDDDDEEEFDAEDTDDDDECGGDDEDDGEESWRQLDEDAAAEDRKRSRKWVDEDDEPRRSSKKDHGSAKDHKHGHEHHQHHHHHHRDKGGGSNHHSHKH
jgi:nucleosome binding factor SPN SPT16 subunit